MAIKILLINLLIFNTCLLVAQPEYQQQENTLGKYVTSLSYDLEIDQLSRLKIPFYFRLWQPGQVIEVWQDSSSVSKGMIINFVSDYDESSLGRRNYFTRLNKLKPTMAAKAFYVISGSEMFRANTQDEYNRVEDPGATEMIIEMCNKGKYSVIGLPRSDLHAAGNVQAVEKMVKDLNKVLSAPEKFVSFSKKIPYPCYKIFPGKVRCK